jgi:Protein of unknown function (DUF1573)
MRYLTLLCNIIIHCSISSMLIAQPDQAEPKPEVHLSTLVQNLDEPKQQLVFDYIQHLTGLEDVQEAFNQMGLQRRGQLVQYAYILETNFKSLEKTTVKWQPDTLHFGTIEEGEILLDSFQITNTGLNPYFIREVKTTCDCTVLRYPTYPVQPGETASIRIEFKSKGKAGDATPGIIIYDNSSPNKRNIVYLQGTVTPRKKPKVIVKN